MKICTRASFDFDRMAAGYFRLNGEEVAARTELVFSILRNNKLWVET